jgi:hypothetical protein
LEVVYRLLRHNLEGYSQAMNVISIPKSSFSHFSLKDRPQTLVGSYHKEGLVLTMTPQDYLIQWSGSASRSGDVRLVDEVTILLYQEERML